MLTTEQRQLLAAVSGRAAIDLVLKNSLASDIQDRMSLVIGRWIIGIQHVMPDEIRNSQEWRDLLTDAVGTGREKDQERLEILMDWMWTAALPIAQQMADQKGFGAEWRNMCNEKTAAAALAVAAAAYASAISFRAISAYATAYAVSRAADCASAAAVAAERAADAAITAPDDAAALSATAVSATVVAFYAAAEFTVSEAADLARSANDAAEETHDAANNYISNRGTDVLPAHNAAAALLSHDAAKAALTSAALVRHLDKEYVSAWRRLELPALLNRLSKA